MKMLAGIAIAMLLTLGGAATAEPKNSDHQKESKQSRGENPPGQDKRPFDPDQGDDNASMTAIMEVCTKDTPAAERSAICRSGDDPVSR